MALGWSRIVAPFRNARCRSKRFKVSEAWSTPARAECFPEGKARFGSVSWDSASLIVTITVISILISIL